MLMHHRRATAAATVLAGLLTLAGATTAHAHGDTISLTGSGVTAGHPTTKATWEEDGHPVDERVAGTFTATSSDGTTLGPWRFVPVPGEPGAYTTAEALPAGRWTVTAQTAFPALGRAEYRAEVTAASLAGATGASAGPAAPARSAARPAAPSPSPTSGAASDASGDGPGAVTIGITALGVAGAGALAALWWRRRHTRHV
ncbi:hypothetical protein [Streptomyces sp. NPDC049555]|uniref:hypothetical protein n=1 Tax=Streptomyces sp. NPDC049555 TaxID=3154930 RepID=UPI00343F1C4A